MRNRMVNTGGQTMMPSTDTAGSISRIGLGTGVLGTLGSSASPMEVDLLLDGLSSSGISVIDTADSYGSGKAERLLGSALRNRRDQFSLMTKAGYRFGDLPPPFTLANPFIKKAYHRFGKRQCFEPKYLERCLNRSLQRLETDWIDVFFLHDPSLGDLSGLDRLRKIRNFRESGKVRKLGVSSGDPEVIASALDGGEIGMVQCPANLRDSAKLLDIWDRCSDAGVTVVANHVMGPGNFGISELTHELRMKAAAALLPAGSIVLCGTRKTDHLVTADRWLQEPIGKDAALELMKRVSHS